MEFGDVYDVTRWTESMMNDITGMYIRYAFQLYTCRSMNVSCLHSCIPSPPLIHPTIRIPFLAITTIMGACLSLARKSPNELAASALHAAADYINPVAQQHANTTAHHNNNTNNNNTYQYQQNNAQTHTITEAYVSKMPDGDTFTCSFTDHNGQQVTSRVRIQGIDCPELAQNFGYVSIFIGFFFQPSRSSSPY